MDNKNENVADAIDNVITGKINQIIENNPSMSKGEIKSEVIESTISDKAEPPESWKSSLDGSVEHDDDSYIGLDEKAAEEDDVEIETAIEEPEKKEMLKEHVEKHNIEERFANAEVSQTPELLTPVTAETFRRLDRIEGDLETLMKAVLELTKSHDGLCANIQSTVLESMSAAPRKTRKKKEELYSNEQEVKYKKILEHFTTKTGKTQRELTNGVNQMVASTHDYTIGAPGDCNSADFILAKVSKDYAVDNTKYLSVDQYLELVKDYVIFITKQEVVFD